MESTTKFRMQQMITTYTNLIGASGLLKKGLPNSFQEKEFGLKLLHASANLL
jgi:hypothetical protein